jgi:hypothetical protein
MELGHLCIFAVLVGPFMYSLRDTKYSSTIFYVVHRLEKNYLKSNVRESSIT